MVWVLERDNDVLKCEIRQAQNSSDYEFEVVSKRGAFFSYGDLRLGQGRENAKDYLRQNFDLMNEIDAVIRQKALSGEIVLPLEIGGGEDASVVAAEEEV